MFLLLPVQQHTLFLCGVLLFVRDTEAEDEALQHVVSSSDIVSLSKKNWYSYTKSFLRGAFSCFVGSSSTNFLSKGLYLFSKASQQFTIFKTSKEKYSTVQGFNKYKFANYRFENDSDLFQKNFDKITNKKSSIFVDVVACKASGQFLTQGSDYQIPKFQPEDSTALFIDHTWNLYLDTRLAADLHFLYISFKTNQHNRFKGNIRVFDAKTFQAEFLYHGLNPAFHIYPRFSHISVKLTFQSRTNLKFSVKAHYSMMDAGILFTKQPDSAQVSKNLLHWVFVGHLKLSVLTFHLQVQKTSYISISVSRDGFLFDGPGFKSKSTSMIKNKKKVLSSFQCVVPILAEYATSAEKFFHFASHPILENISIKVETDDTKFDSASTCKNNPCLAHFYCPLSYFLNITITKVDYWSNDKDTLNCLFGALLVLNEADSGHQEEAAVICTLFNSKTDPPHVYSQHNHVAVLLYWYIAYTFMEASFLVGASKCKAVKLDFCTQAMCEVAIQKHQCYIYLKKNSKGSKMSFEFSRNRIDIDIFVLIRSWGKFWNFNNSLNIKMNEEECAVLQLRHTINFLHSKLAHQCLIRLFAATFKMETITYQFAGWPLSKILFRGKVKRSCDTTKPCAVNSMASKLSQLTNASDTRQVVLEAESPSSEYENLFTYFSFQMQVDLPSDHWLDVILMSSKSPYQVDSKNLTEFIPIKGLLHYKIIQQLNFLCYDMILTTNHPYKRTPGHMMMDRSLEIYYGHFHVKYLWSQITITMPISFSTARPNKYLNLHTLPQQSYFVFCINLDYPILIAPYGPLKKYFSHFVPEKKKRNFTQIQLKWQPNLRPQNFSVNQCSEHINSSAQFLGCYNVSSRDKSQPGVVYIQFTMLGVVQITSKGKATCRFPCLFKVLG